MRGSSDFWKTVKQLTRKERSDKRIGPVRNKLDTLVYDDKDKAKTLNSIFPTEGKKLASKFTPASGFPLSFIHRITPTIDLYDEIPLQDK